MRQESHHTPHTPHPIINEPLMNESQVSHMTGLARGTLRNMRHHKKGIPFFKIGRLVRYAPQDVRDFLKNKYEPCEENNEENIDLESIDLESSEDTQNV